MVTRENAALLLVLAVTLTVGCTEQRDLATVEEGRARPPAATAILRPVGDSGVYGIVRFTPGSEGVRVTASVQGLAAGGHGFHIHEYGDCSNAATGAGGHYDPFETRHGAPIDVERHAGDLGNIVADSDGIAYYREVDPVLELTGDHAIIGRAVVVHARPDDFTSQPAGDSGKPVACGVIGIAPAE